MMVMVMMMMMAVIMMMRMVTTMIIMMRMMMMMTDIDDGDDRDDDDDDDDDDLQEFLKCFQELNKIIYFLHREHLMTIWNCSFSLVTRSCSPLPIPWLLSGRCSTM